MSKETIIGFADKAAFICFMIMAFFIPTSNAAVEICFGIILFCFMLKVVLKKPSWNDMKCFLKNRINLSLLVFFVFMGFSLFASRDLLSKSFSAWTCKWGEMILLFYLVQFFLDKKQIRIVLIIFMVSAFLTSLSGFWQQITGFDFLRGYELARTENFTAIRACFYHYNDFAAFLVAMFFIVYGFLRQEKAKAIKWILCVFLSMLFVNLILTYSRGGWAAFFIAVIIAIVFFPEKKQRLLMSLFLFVGIIGIAIIPVARERFLWTFGPLGDSERFFLWQGAFAMFKDSPFFGTGVGLFMDRLAQYSEFEGRYAHNSYLQILAETGMLGLGSFLWFLWELISAVYKKLKKEKDPLFTGVLLGVMAFLVHSFFDTQFYSLRLSMFFWMMAGMISVYAIGESKKGVCATVSQA